MNYINKGKRDILIIPEFNNINEIQTIREKYDELCDIIMPHITLAFPFKKDISSEQLKQQLIDITTNIKPFKMKCKGITLRKDERIGTYGNTNNPDEKIELNEEFETIVNSIVVEQIGENEESIIEFEIKL